jgi:hypothetical protein
MSVSNVRTALAKFFFGPICPDCNRRHTTGDIASSFACNLRLYQQTLHDIRERQNISRIPKRLLAVDTSPGAGSFRA